MRQAAITDIKVADEGSAVRITVTTSAKAAYSLVQQTAPPRLLLELAQTGVGNYYGTIAVRSGPVSHIRPTPAGANSTLEVALSAEAEYDIESQGQTIVLRVSPNRRRRPPCRRGNPPPAESGFPGPHARRHGPRRARQ